MDYFTLTGTAGGKPAVVAWTEQDRFVSDPDGRCADAVQEGVEVQGTATGPFYLAAASPAVVAFLTALSVLDEGPMYDEGADAVQAQLDELTAVPAKATA